MAESTDRSENQEIQDEQTTRPFNWPGIPGRSQEREARPEGEKPARSDAEVTEAQRELERELER
jgi:hypothetical protein